MREDGQLARLFIAGEISPDRQVNLSREQSHYLTKVMRLNEGDTLRIFNADDGEWRAEITEGSAKGVSLSVTEKLRTPNAVPDITLAFGLLKKPRLSALVEKATELGASAFLPLITDRVQFPKIGLEKFRAQIIEAAEQTERMDIPPLQPAQKLAQFLAAHPPARPLIFADEAAAHAAPAAKVFAQITSPLTLLIGPEGGFSAGERAAILAHPAARPVTLGPRILRAETAAMALLTLAQSHCGDWAAAPELRS